MPDAAATPPLLFIIIEIACWLAGLALCARLALGRLGPKQPALAPWIVDRGTDGQAMFLYNQRKHGEPGVWLAVVRPTDGDFGIEHNEIIWRAATRTQSNTSGDPQQWSDFSFGEPSIAQLEDGTCLVALWCIQPTGTGIQYVRLGVR
jgi:hypothetical protein